MREMKRKTKQKLLRKQNINNKRLRNEHLRKSLP